MCMPHQVQHVRWGWAFHNITVTEVQKALVRGNDLLFNKQSVLTVYLTVIFIGKQVIKSLLEFWVPLKIGCNVLRAERNVRKAKSWGWLRNHAPHDGEEAVWLILVHVATFEHRLAFNFPDFNGCIRSGREI